MMIKIFSYNDSKFRVLVDLDDRMVIVFAIGQKDEVETNFPPTEIIKNWIKYNMK